MGQVSTGFESGLGVGWEQFPENRWESSLDNPLSGSYSLHHAFDNTISGTDRISVKTGTYDFDHNISWEFILKHDYTPSSTNKWEVLLATEKGAIETGTAIPRNGYIFGVNISGTDDSLRIGSIRNGVLSILGTCSINYERDIGTSAFHCLISRDSTAVWKVFAAKAGDSLINIATVMEKKMIMPELSHFMLSYHYTSTKDRLFWFDDLSIKSKFLTDTIPPEISQFKILNRNSIQLVLSEEIENATLIKENFLLQPGNQHPDEINLEGTNLFCTFSDNFIQKTNYQLFAIGLRDKKGNISGRDSISFFFYQAGKNDLVFTEIMADPSPPVYLRESEYIEIFSRCEFPLDLDSFILQTGKREWLITPYIINPGEYLVITSGTESGYNTLPLFTSSSVITNDFQQILLKNKYREIITASEFYGNWYRDTYKAEGGWSLERIDANNLCGGKENWKASENYLGGTPGSKNSVQEINTDISVPFIQSVEFITGNKICLKFNENIDPLTIPVADSFYTSSSSIKVDSVKFPEYFCSYIEIVFSDTLQNGFIYQLEVPEGITDCEGNPLYHVQNVSFGLPAITEFADVIISEVMFTSLPGCPEYVELYNLSDKLLDLSDLRISINKEGETGKPAIPLKNPVLFFPGEYLVLCKNKEALLTCHTIVNTNSILEATELPSLTDEGTCISLLNRSLNPIDVFCYKPEDEFPMLADNHGVALERLKLDRNTGNESFWHSASSLADFGTPGMPNSQSLSDTITQKTIEILPQVFTPDNNGIDDFAEVRYSINKEGFIGTFGVFDPSGNQICFLGENEILGTTGMFLWDGRDDKGNICKSGMYLVFAEIWNLNGEKERFKKVVVLVRK